MKKLVLMIILILSMQSNTAYANDFNCWFCHNSCDRAVTQNCKTCNWDICSNCGACKYGCIQLETREQHIEANRKKAIESRIWLYIVLGVCFAFFGLPLLITIGQKVKKYDKYGYDRNGYKKDGYNCYGYNREGYDRNGYDRNGYDRNGYNYDGYDRCGYNKEDVDRYGCGRDGYDKDGYDKDGYNKEGYNRYGYNRDGYNRDGIDKHGYNRDGYDKDGYNKYGYGKDGFNKYGYDRHGYDKDGYNIDGYNKYGYDKEGGHIYGYSLKYLKTKNSTTSDHTSQKNIFNGLQMEYIRKYKTTLISVLDFPSEVFDENFCRAIVQINHHAIEFIPEKYITPELHQLAEHCKRYGNNPRYY